MKKKTKTVISLLIIIPVIISLSVGVHIAGIYKKLEGKPSQLVWNENDKYNYNIDKDAYILTVDEKSDFKILNLTDLQLSEGMSQKRINRTYKLVRQLIQETNPSIVTFTGDNTWLKNSKKAKKMLTYCIDEGIDELSIVLPIIDQIIMILTATFNTDVKEETMLVIVNNIKNKNVSRLVKEFTIIKNERDEFEQKKKDEDEVITKKPQKERNTKDSYREYLELSKYTESDNDE